MRVGSHHYRTIWPEDAAVVVMDQTRLPFGVVPKTSPRLKASLRHLTTRTKTETGTEKP